MKKLALCGAVAIAVATASSATMAYEGGNIVIRGGLTHVDPDSGMGDVFITGDDSTLDAGVASDTSLGLNFVYFVDQHWAVELLAATPFKHDVDLSNGDKLADVKQLPPTLSALYYFNDNSSEFQPYAGVGINYTTFFEEDVTSAYSDAFSDLNFEHSWGLAAQVGFDYKLNETWLINGSVRYIDIDTTGTFTFDGDTPGSVDVEIDPIITSLMIGYQF